MKKLLYSIIILTYAFSCWGKRDYYSVEFPEAPADSNAIALYDYYGFSLVPFGLYDRFSTDRELFCFGCILHLKDDFTCEIVRNDSNEFIGEWRVIDDTLFLYEDYYEPGYDFFTQEDLDTLDQDLVERLTAPIRRQFYDVPELTKDYPYPANVGVFLIEDFGDYLTPVIKNNMGGHYISRRGKSQTCNWVSEKFDWQNGDFKVIKTSGHEKHINKVLLKKDGIFFNIVNPRYYLQTSKMNLYEPKDENKLSAWMDTVKVGHYYRFELQRPAYPADSAAHCKRLHTTPNTIYISRGDMIREAYGYFFARIIPDSIN